MLVEDADTWNKIIGHSDGYIYNDFGTQFPGNAPTWNTTNFNKLHRASCTKVKIMTYINEGKLTKHFFRSRKEATNWLEKNRKEQGYTLCSYCNPWHVHMLKFFATQFLLCYQFCLLLRQRLVHRKVFPPTSRNLCHRVQQFLCQVHLLRIVWKYLFSICQ